MLPCATPPEHGHPFLAWPRRPPAGFPLSPLLGFCQQFIVRAQGACSSQHIFRWQDRGRRCLLHRQRWVPALLSDSAMPSTWRGFPAAASDGF